MITFRIPSLKISMRDAILILLWLFLLVFPKGGIKIAGIPLTWGYLFLNLTALCLTFSKIHKCQISRIHSYFLMLPFQVISGLSLVVHGILDKGFAISFVLSFFFFPWIFLIVLSKHIEEINLEFLFKLIKHGIFFVALFGVFAFLFKIITGKFIEIPLLTVNLQDIGELENKNINRGSIYKLISTYNNGNIYGICLLMFLPLYLFIERKKWRTGIVALSLILSLSRTVWIGLLFSEFIFFLFSRKTFSTFFRIGLILFLAFLTFLSVSIFFGFDLDFILDKSLGGRALLIERAFNDFSILPNRPFGSLWEMVYLGILFYFGILGLIAYLIALISPFILIICRGKIHPIQIPILSGLLNFLFVSMSDGAVLFIPVMAFYWFLSSLLLRRDFSFPLSSSGIGFSLREKNAVG